MEGQRQRARPSGQRPLPSPRLLSRAKAVIEREKRRAHARAHTHTHTHARTHTHAHTRTHTHTWGRMRPKRMAAYVVSPGIRQIHPSISPREFLHKPAQMCPYLVSVSFHGPTSSRLKKCDRFTHQSARSNPRRLSTPPCNTALQHRLATVNRRRNCYCCLQCITNSCPAPIHGGSAHRLAAPPPSAGSAQRIKPKAELKGRGGAGRGGRVGGGEDVE